MAKWWLFLLAVVVGIIAAPPRVPIVWIPATCGGRWVRVSWNMTEAMVMEDECGMSKQNLGRRLVLHGALTLWTPPLGLPQLRQKHTTHKSNKLCMLQTGRKSYWKCKKEDKQFYQCYRRLAMSIRWGKFWISFCKKLFSCIKLSSVT